MSFKNAGVDWKLAKCDGMDRELFFLGDPQNRPNKQEKQNNFHNTTIRPICFSCPIWEGCLQYAFEHEEYGTWGGLSELERTSFKTDRFQATYDAAIEELAKYGISERKIRSLM